MTESELQSEILKNWDSKWPVAGTGMFFYPASGYLFPISAGVHLYKDANRWAAIFETTGYYNRLISLNLTLFYFGNCLLEGDGIYSSGGNLLNVTLCSEAQLNELSVENGEAHFEFVAASHNLINIRGILIQIEKDPSVYLQHGLELEASPSGKPLIPFVPMLRLLSIRHPDLFHALSWEIEMRLPEGLTKLVTLRDWHHDEDLPPSEQESYQQMAAILAQGNPMVWKPSLPSNLHWSNWPSAGDL